MRRIKVHKFQPILPSDVSVMKLLNFVKKKKSHCDHEQLVLSEKNEATSTLIILFPL